MVRGLLIIGMVGLLTSQVGCASFVLVDTCFAGTTEAGTPFTVWTIHAGHGQPYAKSTSFRRHSMHITWYKRDESAGEPDWNELRGLGGEVLVGKWADGFLRRDNDRLVAGFHAFSRGDRVWFVWDGTDRVIAAADLERGRVYPWAGPVPRWSTHDGVPVENRVQPLQRHGDPLRAARAATPGPPDQDQRSGAD